MLQKAPFRLPPGFLTKFGYPGRRRFVALFWEPGGDEACNDDGKSFACGLCDNGLFLGFVYQSQVDSWLNENGIHLGDSEREARHWLVADALTGDLYAAPPQGSVFRGSHPAASPACRDRVTWTGGLSQPSWTTLRHRCKLAPPATRLNE